MIEFLKLMASAMLVLVLTMTSSYSAAPVAASDVNSNGFDVCEFASEQSDTSEEEEDEEPDCD